MPPLPRSLPSVPAAVMQIKVKVRSETIKKWKARVDILPPSTRGWQSTVLSSSSSSPCQWCHCVALLLFLRLVQHCSRHQAHITQLSEWMKWNRQWSTQWHIIKHTGSGHCTLHTHTHTLPPDSGVQLYDVKIAPTVCLGALSGNAHFVKCKRHLKTHWLQRCPTAVWRFGGSFQSWLQMEEYELETHRRWQIVFRLRLRLQELSTGLLFSFPTWPSLHSTCNRTDVAPERH